MIDGIGNPNNLNIGVGRGQTPDISKGAMTLKGKGIADGTVVEGRVLSAENGTYTVRIAGQNLMARSNLTLYPGQHFQALWDAKGDVPVLRLRPEDAALLGKLPQGDREAASLLLSKGLPLTDELMLGLRREFRRLGGDSVSMNSLVELMARGEAVTSEKANLLSWYLSMDSNSVAAQWRRIREELRERSRRGEHPLESLRDMKEGEDESSLFLRAHSLVSRPPREPFSHAALAGAWWPSPDEDSLPARVRFSSSGGGPGEERRYYQVSFALDGVAIGEVSGRLESDGKALAVSINAEDPAGRDSISERLDELRDDLSDLGMSLQYLGVEGRRKDDGRRYLRLDIEA
ncbi:MAG: hypothetical protein U9Q00_06860 [Synergistota bacterium]|nr:hypothetical protein [Synergistota bacterium]